MFTLKTIIKKNQKILNTNTHFKIIFKLWTQWTKAAASNYGWAPLFLIHSLLSCFRVPSVSVFCGTVCSGTLTAPNSQFSKASNRLERLASSNELQMSICLFEEKYLLPKTFVFLSYTLSLLKNICHPIVYTLALCYFIFIHHKWISRGEECFTCTVNCRWPQTCLWSHKPVFKLHLWDGGQYVCVCWWLLLGCVIFHLLLNKKWSETFP